MFLRRWEALPKEMQNEQVRPYYDTLCSKWFSLLCKAIFDRVVAVLMLFCLSPIFVLLAIWIKTDSKGEVFFRQERVTQYGKVFRIFKFRTMVANAESLGSQVTVQNDMRITKVGKVLRKCRLDELPQLLNIIQGDMSFVGTRPEVVKYVRQYTPAMYATLLLPAGVTSEASIQYKDEDELLANATDADKVYVEEVLPGKMAWNLKSIKEFSFVGELGTCVKTVLAVMGKD